MNRTDDDPEENDREVLGSHGSHARAHGADDPDDRLSQVSVRSSASQERQVEAQVQLAKRQAEALSVLELEVLEKELADLDARRKKLLLKREMDSLSAEIQARKQIDEEDRRLHDDLLRVHPIRSNPWAPDAAPPPPVVAHDHGSTRGDTALLVEMMRRQTAFSSKITSFTGDPLYFNYFMRQVEDVIEQHLSDGRTRLIRLLEVVEGDPKRLIEGCLFVDDQVCYDEAKRLLKRRYGNDIYIANKFMEELRNWPQVKDNCVKGLQDIYSAMIRCSSIVVDSELNSPRFIGELLQKFSYHVRNSWRTIVLRSRRDPGSRETFQLFVRFVEDLLDKASDPIYGEEAIKAAGSCPKSPPERDSGPKKIGFPRRMTSLVTSTSANMGVCLECGANHDVEKCPKYLNRSKESKQNMIKEKGACFGCLSVGHFSKKCSQRRICKTCERQHPTSLHVEKEKDNEVRIESDMVNVRAIGLKGAVVAMSVVRVVVSHSDDPAKQIEGLALLDPLSSGTFATVALQRALEISGPTTKIAIHTVSGEETVETTVLTGLCVQDPDRGEKVDLRNVFTRKSIPLQPNEIASPRLLERWTAFEGLRPEIARLDPQLPVILLIGADTPDALRPLNVIIGDQSDPLSPYAIKMKLGWSVMGPMGGDASERRVTCNRTLALPNRIVGREVLKDLGVAEMLSSLVDSDFTMPKLPPSLVTIGMDDSMSGDDLKFIEILEQGTRYKNGADEVPLPIRNRPLVLPESRMVALKRVTAIVRTLQGNQSSKRDYFEFMSELIRHEYAREVSPAKLKNTPMGMCHYIPHHAVYHPQKQKIRVVFNCANQVGGRPINDELLTGPDLTNQLVGVLLRFRKEPVAFAGDIEKMFYRVHVPEEDMNYLRFFWFKNNNETEDFVEYEMTRHLFGGRSSPSCANYALRRTAADHGSKFSKSAVDTVNRNFYVDDCLKSVATVEEAVNLTNEVKELWANRELQEALNEMNEEAVAAFLNERGSDYEGWKRNPPAASNFGGVWERQIKSIRAILSSLMKHHGLILNDETFRTLLCEIEGIINSRPLTVENLSDPMSPLPLSPAMLLTQKTKVILPPPGSFVKNDVFCRRHWRRTQYLADQFWTRFRREYLESLQPRSKWIRGQENLEVGDIVILKDDNTPRNLWKLARVIETYPDQEGIVRSARVCVGDRNAKDLKTFSKSEFHRPVNKLILLQRAQHLKGLELIQTIHQEDS
ncbi:uncharacterized protein LOC131887601 [Tigriopus californicus]|uniref:uncharacterized protein LOC131887601 n=1 Tax=Tigriopus californicus TaxID=6832 RepID=UPI0027D9FAEF|nr:uncharacterized protein LOC131887601 [Tigriopus californicus]